MMLEHLGQPEAARQLMLAIEKVTGEQNVLPADLGGDAPTNAVRDAIIEAL